MIASFIKNIDYSQTANKTIQVLYPEHSGLYYDWFIEEKTVGFCKECGDIFKQGKTRGAKREYCKDCRKYTPTNGKRTVICIDCGYEFEVNSTARRVCRCDACQKIKNNILKREWDDKNRKR